jgi:hypothetical protein
LFYYMIFILNRQDNLKNDHFTYRNEGF